MKKFHAARLIKLVNFLKDVPRKSFYFGCFADKGSYGTVACAIGWAGLLPEFRKSGLKTDVENNEVILQTKSSVYEYCAAAQAFFGLNREEACGIFLPGFQDSIKSRQLSMKAPASAVIKNIVKVIKMNDFDVVEKNGRYELK